MSQRTWSWTALVQLQNKRRSLHDDMLKIRKLDAAQYEQKSSALWFTQRLMLPMASAKGFC
jgi:hypothetical protein